MPPSDPLEYPRFYRNVVRVGVAAMALVWAAIVAVFAFVVVGSS
jgi:hypothetical protein